MKVLLAGKNIVFALLVLVVAALGVFSVILYSKYNEALKKPSGTVQSSAAASAKEVQNLIKTVSKIADLPTNEAPTVATVDDASQLSGQLFFKGAKNGDKVLVYELSQKAYLYRPSTNKIVNIGPVSRPSVTPGAGTASSSATITEEKVAKVLLLNGTTKVGLTKLAEEVLEKNNISIEVVDRDNATASDYKETIVVDLGKNAESVSQIIKSIGGKAAKLPDTQDVSDGVDIVIILGEDFQAK